MEQKRFYFSKGIFLKRYFQKKILSKTIAKVNSSKNSLDERKKKRLFKWEEFILDDVNPTNYHKSSNNNKRSSTEKLKM